MKTITNLLYGLGLVAVVATLSACSGSSSPTVDVVVPPPVRANLAVALLATVQDAATSLPIQPAAPDTVSIAVYGADAAKVVDGNGNSIYSASNGYAGPLTASNGIFTIYVKPGTPLPTQMSLRLVATAKNFVSSSINLLINSSDLNADGSTTSINVNIALTSQTAPPPTVVAVATPVTLTNSTTAASATNIKTSDSTTTVNGAPLNLGSASVVVPPSTVIYADANKTVLLPAGTTSVNVTYNNNNTSESLAVFPGGFTTSQDTTGAALASPGVFITGGFVSIEVSSTAANGTVTQARSFDKPLAVTIPIPKATINPQTGVAVAAGDTIPIWSYDTTTGQWTVLKLTNGTVVSGTLGALDVATNTYPVPFSTDHLSIKTAAWLVAPVETCSATVQVLDTAGNSLLLLASRVSGGWQQSWNLPAAQNKSAGGSLSASASVSHFIAVKRTPTRFRVYLNVDAPQEANLVGDLTVADACTSGTINMDVTAAVARLSPSFKLADVGVQVNEVCINDKTKKTPVSGDSVFAISSGAPRVSTSTDKAGSATLKSLIWSVAAASSTSSELVNGGVHSATSSVLGLYRFTVNNRDKQSQSRDYTVLESNNPLQTFDFPVACQAVTGAF